MYDVSGHQKYRAIAIYTARPPGTFVNMILLSCYRIP
jgi:hypothetical protein